MQADADCMAVQVVLLKILFPPPPLITCNSGAKPCSEHSQWLYPLFARSAQASNALTVDLNPLMTASSERILFKKPLLKSSLLTHYYKFFNRGGGILRTGSILKFVLVSIPKQR
jgi:hypothetical protein